MGCDFATEILRSGVVGHYILRDSTDIQVRILARTSATGYTVAGEAVRTVAEAVAIHSIPAGIMANSFLAEVEDRGSNTLAGTVGFVISMLGWILLGWISSVLICRLFFGFA